MGIAADSSGDDRTLGNSCADANLKSVDSGQARFKSLKSFRTGSLRVVKCSAENDRQENAIDAEGHETAALEVV